MLFCGLQNKRLSALLATIIVLLYASTGAAGLSDVHIHLMLDSEKDQPADISGMLQKSNISQAIVISPSYHEKVYPDRSSDKRIIYDQKTTEVLEKIDSKTVVGACGYSPAWDYSEGLKIVSQCLDSAKMKGIKIHMSAMAEEALAENQSLNFEDHFDKIVKTLDRLNEKKDKVRFVLIHLADFHFKYVEFAMHDSVLEKKLLQKDQANLDKMFRLTLEFPNIQFVVAHSFGSPRNFSSFIKKFAHKKQDNLWVETSALLKYFSSDIVMEQWRKFGFQRVLFGSDTLIFSKTETSQFSDKFKIERERFDKKTIQLLDHSSLVFWDRIK